MRGNHNQTKLIYPVSLVFLLTGIFNSISSQTISSNENTQLGWGVILLIIVMSISFIIIVFGFCIDKPVIFITIGLFIPLLIFVVLKVWPKEINTSNTNSIGITTSDKLYSVYDMYETTKNYRVLF